MIFERIFLHKITIGKSCKGRELFMKYSFRHKLNETFLIFSNVLFNEIFYCVYNYYKYLEKNRFFFFFL